jgi:hypothetical protein
MRVILVATLTACDTTIPRSLRWWFGTEVLLPIKAGSAGRIHPVGRMTTGF